MKFTTAFLKHVITDRVVQLFLVAHLVSIVFLYSWADGKEISSENYYFQPLLLKIFAVINLPSILITGLIFAPFVIVKTFPEENSSLEITSYYSVLIILSFLQWLLIGYGVSKLIRK